MRQVGAQAGTSSRVEPNHFCLKSSAYLWLKLEEALHENLELQALHTKWEDQINTLVMKQRRILHRKIDETLDAGWKQWSAQAAELQLLRADAENH